MPHGFTAGGFRLRLHDNLQEDLCHKDQQRVYRTGLTDRQEGGECWRLFWCDCGVLFLQVCVCLLSCILDKEKAEEVSGEGFLIISGNLWSFFLTLFTHLFMSEFITLLSPMRLSWLTAAIIRGIIDWSPAGDCPCVMSTRIINKPLFVTVITQETASAAWRHRQRGCGEALSCRQSEYWRALHD